MTSSCFIAIWIVYWTSNKDCFIESFIFCFKFHLIHWGRVTHICVSKLTIIGSNNGLSPGRCQAIIWTNAGILLIGPLGRDFSEILIEIYTFSLKKCIWNCHLEKAPILSRPQCIFNVYSWWPNWQVSIGSGNGLARSRKQCHYINQWWPSYTTLFCRRHFQMH